MSRGSDKLHRLGNRDNRGFIFIEPLERVLGGF